MIHKSDKSLCHQAMPNPSPVQKVPNDVNMMPATYFVVFSGTRAAGLRSANPAAATTMTATSSPSSNTALDEVKNPVRSVMSAGPKIATIAMIAANPHAAPESADRHDRVNATANTAVSASTASAADAKNAVPASSHVCMPVFYPPRIDQPSRPAGDAGVGGSTSTSSAAQSSRKNAAASVTRPIVWNEPRSESFVTLAGLMSTFTTRTVAGSMFPTAIECSSVQIMS